MNDAADHAEIRDKVLGDRSSAYPTEMRLLSTKDAWRMWDRVQTLPAGDLKVIYRNPGKS